MNEIVTFLELLGEFWLFIFNKRHRKNRIKLWKKSGFILRIGMVLIGFVSFFAGVVFPGLLLWFLITELAKFTFLS